MTTHALDAETVHYEWNNALAPRLTVDPGDTVVFDTRDAADRFYSKTSVADDVLQRVFKGHALTGPVKVRGAAPGDTLVVDVLEMVPALDFGWTQIRPGRGLLTEQDFPKPHLCVWDLSDTQVARMPNRPIAVPLDPFPGVMGVALDQPGPHSTMPPRRNGGNMDIKQLTAGATLYLPVLVDGALFSIGDGHGAQGDGEVCITAVEMSARVTLRFDLQRGRRIAEPRFRTRGPIGLKTNRGPHFATTAHGPDLHANAQQAIRYMIEHLVEERGLTREEAYVLCSVAVDLRISEIVDAPNWIVSAFLPESVFV
ncbi:MAG: acetamidase/formamidase family protein [Candidatus Rokubacteria bacterium]|nr:acetamidase/formamidase family protein [Candidatus Rokubacteria bacterium]